jgi:hypothetical protein
MTLREHIAKLQRIASENPKALDYKVITSADSEGNSYSDIYSKYPTDKSVGFNRNLHRNQNAE